MSRPLRDRIWDGLANALLTALAGFGLSLLLLTALFGQVDWTILISACAATALVFCAAQALYAPASAILMAVLAGVVILGCVNLGPLASMAQSLRVFWVYPDLLGAALPPYRLMFSTLLPVLMTALCSFAVIIEAPTLTLLPMVLLSIVFGTELIGNTALPALAGAGACTAAYLLALARERVRLTAWPLAVLALACGLTFLIMPRSLPQTPALREAAEEVYLTVSDYLPSSDESARSGFTLETEGYLPLGSDTRPRLGGAAEPSDRPIMEVRTDHALYLRGVAMNSYNGLNWDDTLSGRRFLYADLLQQGYRRNVFDEYLPLTNESLAVESASVHMLSAAATTLYVPQRLRSLELRSGRMTPYFNAGSELFLTRELAAGDGYAFTYLNLPADSEKTARIAAEAAAVADTRFEEITQIYTALPSHMQRELYALSYAAAGGEESPYRQALSIRNYLRDNYVYSLDVAEPPDNMDFAAWFLLREKKGYCTYFATAMTLLCRMQGIPARYVTGYLAVPEDGLATVTSADAHAWTEIYLNGFGWLTLDATPGRELNGDDEGGDDLQPGPDDTNEPTPTPEPEPELTASPAPDEKDMETEAPPSTPEPRATEEPAPAEPPARHGSPWLLVIFILLALAALLLAAVILMDPVRRAKRRPRQAFDILMAAVEAGMERLFRPRSAGETVIEYYTAAAARFPDLPLTDLAEAYSARVYGHKPVRADLALGVWQRVSDRLSFFQRMGIILSGIAAAGE